MKLLYRSADDTTPGRTLVLIDKALGLKLWKRQENTDVQVQETRPEQPECFM